MRGRERSIQPQMPLCWLARAEGDLLMNGEEDSDICGLCGLPGADKLAHPVRWPGEQRPETPFVHADCEAEECRRAHSALTDEQRKEFLRGLR